MIWRSNAPLVVAFLCHLGAVSIALPLVRETAPGPPGPAGYVYHGKVDFVDELRPGVRIASADVAPKALANSLDGLSLQSPYPRLEHRTVLVTREGHLYHKRLDSESALDVVFEARAPELTRGRRLAQFTIRLPDIQDVSTDLSCDGCSQVDDRVQVTDGSVYPYSAVGQLIGQLRNSPKGLECTGTLVGPRHVVTAAHCVFDINDSRQMVSSLDFSPGLTTSGRPFGIVEWSTVRILDTFTQQSGYSPTAMNVDFALITLKEDVDPAAGYLGMIVGQGSVTLDLTTAGYPGEKPENSMWRGTCKNIEITYNANQPAFDNVVQCRDNGCYNILEHTCISSNGQSGSSMWDGDKKIRAILTGKVSTSDNQAFNVGTKIDSFVYNTIAGWYNEDAAGTNNTLPLAPSGPQPPSTRKQGGSSFWDNIGWTDPLTILVLVAIGLVLVVVPGIFLLLWCCRGWRERRRAATQPKPLTVPGVPVQSLVGVTYDPRTQQFYLNGQPYGQFRQ